MSPKRALIDAAATPRRRLDPCSWRGSKCQRPGLPCAPMRQASCGVLLVLLASSAWAQRLTRGPYLQLASPNGITVAFRTDVQAVARVRYGLTPQALTQSVTEVASSTEHAVRLSSLTASTRYFYEIELDGVLAVGGPEYRFRTHPMPGTIEGFRLFAWGDSGTGGSGQFNVANRMANQVGDATLSLILGDIIYPDGEPQDYDPKFFRPYASLLRRQVIWPVVGNHDVHFDPTGGPWIDAYLTPANNPANTELYYSFDYGNAHFVVLDTHVNSYSASSAQLQWAAADLSASTATWKLVAFHVPPYTGGTHLDSSSVKNSIVPMLERQGVDVVFAGHSHSYERTFLLSNNTIVQNDPSTYVKATRDAGTLYIVSGTAGQSGSLLNPNHPLMAFQAGNVLGTTVVDVAGDSLHGYFLKDDGSSLDLFSLHKPSDVRGPQLMAARALSPTSVEASFDEPVVAGTGPTGAQRPAAWSITPSVAVTSVALRSDARTVVLTTAPHPSGTYALSANGVADRAVPANTVLAGQSVPYTVTSGVDGGILDAGSVDAGSVDAGQERDAGGLLLVSAITPVRYLVPDASVPEWERAQFDDSQWGMGRQPIGYGETRAATTVDMGSAVTLFTRFEFDLFVAPSAVRELVLEVDYDDGFVAFLNGTEVARRGVSANQSWQTLASGHESGLSEVFPLVGAEQLLVTGDNRLAIEVHNSAVSSSDLFLQARLWANAVVQPSDAGSVPDPDDAGMTGGGGGGGALITGGGNGSTGGGTAGGVASGGGGTDVRGGCGCSTGEALVSLLGLGSLFHRRQRKASVAKCNGGASSKP